MSQETTIGWTAWRDHNEVWLPGGTWNIWRGCTEVHTGCAECYARKLIETRLAKMTRDIYKICGVKDWDTCPLWGDQSPRVRGKTARNMPLALQRDYQERCRAGKTPMDKPRVFLGSLMDWLDDCPAGVCDARQQKVISAVEVLADAMDVIRRCPDVTFICLSKRPGDWHLRMSLVREYMASQQMQDLMVFKWIQGEPPSNVWFLASVSDQRTYNDTVPKVLDVPAVVRGLSAEPLVGPLRIDMTHFVSAGRTGENYQMPQLHWLISGVESGPDRRKTADYASYAQNLFEQCRSTDVKVFHKQMANDAGNVTTDINEWPAWARIQEFPV